MANAFPRVSDYANRVQYFHAVRQWYLINQLDHLNIDNRTSAASALAQIGNKGNPTGVVTAVTAQLASASTNNTQAVRLQHVAVLRGLGGAAAKAALQAQALVETDAKVLSAINAAIAVL